MTTDPLAAEIATFIDELLSVSDGLSMGRALNIITEQQRRLEVAREALKYYADDNTYDDSGSGCTDSDCCDQRGVASIEVDTGDKAKQALATLEGSV